MANVSKIAAAALLIDFKHFSRSLILNLVCLYSSATMQNPNMTMRNKIHEDATYLPQLSGRTLIDVHIESDREHWLAETSRKNPFATWRGSVDVLRS